MKALYISIGLNIVLIIGLFYLIFDLGILRGQKEILEIRNQVLNNTKDIQTMANWLNGQVNNQVKK